MKKRWRNIFFICGLTAVALMLLGMKSDWPQMRQVLGQAGIWFPAIVLLWGVIYTINTCSFGLIVGCGHTGTISFSRMWQLTLSGYALNYVTPLGLLGGEPYRILELSDFVGKKKAAAATLLYAMMHVCSHFCLWMTGIAVYSVLHFTADAQKYPLGTWMTVMLSVLAAVTVFVLFMFSVGFRKGFVLKVFSLLDHIPLVRRWSSSYLASHSQQLSEVDELIADLHASNRNRFWSSLALEYAARVMSSAEYWLLMGLFVTGFTFWDGLLVLAFSSLFSNLIFFSPMQLGGREGGMAIAAGGLQIPGVYGVYVALVTRARELVWTIVGIFLMKICHGKRTAD